MSMDELIKKLESTKQVLEGLATKEDLEKLAEQADLMRHIAVASAAKVEDKAEAGYGTLESLFKGFEDRLDQRFNHLSDIMRIWVSNQNLLDDELKKLKERIEKLSSE